jgi:hypothetical protein
VTGDNGWRVVPVLRRTEPPDPAWGIDGGPRRCAECGDRIDHGTYCLPCQEVLDRA